MALTPTIQATQGLLSAVTSFTAPTLTASQLTGLAVANFPSESMRSTQGHLTVVTERLAPTMNVSQALVIAVVRGRTYNPKLRAWSFTLDGHDFYVLRLGENKTLIYDLLTEQWSQYTSSSLPFWRPNLGINWYSCGTVPQTYGSNVVAGDDNFGHLWILNPEQGFDDNPRTPNDATDTFPRSATGQVITRQRISLPVYEVFLTGSFGTPSVSGDTVELSYSDDLGNTYVSAGARSVTSSDYKQQFSWRSLGLITQAGRLFRIDDSGAFARIDGLDCRIGGLEDG